MKPLLYLTIVLFLSSCYELEYSPEEYETGHVSLKHYEPSSTSLVPVLDSDGDIGVEIKTTPEQYILKFYCEHGKVFQVSEDNAKVLWGTLNQGDEVIITYRRMERVYNKNGKESDRKFHDFEFITAHRKQDNPEK